MGIAPRRYKCHHSVPVPSRAQPTSGRPLSVRALANASTKPGTVIMKTRVFLGLLGFCLCSSLAFAQQKTITGKVTNETGAPLSGVSVIIQGTTSGTSTNTAGNYSVRATVGQVLQYRLIGNAPEQRTVGAADVIDVQL